MEDDIFLQQLYHELLEQEGYDVTVSAEGNDAEKKILSKKWSLVLLDVVLPGKDGFAIFNAVREKISFPLIFLTNLDGSQEDIKKLKKAHGYWIKSNMSPPEFITRVNTVFKSS